MIIQAENQKFNILYTVNKIATRCNFINRRLTCGSPGAIPNLYYEIMLLSMTGSRMKLETIKNIISNLYYEIIFLSTTGSRMRFY